MLCANGRLVVLVITAAIGAGGCWQMADTSLGDEGAPLLTLGIDDTDWDGDTDTWPPLIEDEDQGGLFDPVSSLIWQNPPIYDTLPWMEAMDYCNDLEWQGFDDWRLPDVDELQTLLRGCPGAELCGVDDPQCLESSCNDGPDCAGCSEDLGPAAEGCYWDSGLDGWCERYWASSPSTPGFYRYWMVDFVRARPTSDDQYVANGVRCIRDPA
jgi:hypothetical protein